MNKKTVTFFASAGLLFVTIIWGFAFVVVKNTLDNIPPVWMMAFRFSIAAICLSVIFIRRLLKCNLKTLIHGIIIGLTLFFAYAFQTIGCKYTTAGKNAFLTTTYVILVPFVNWALYKKRPALVSVFAALLSLTGIALLSLRGNFTMNTGDILTLICGVCYALQIVFIARYSSDDDPILLSIIQIALTALLSWITAPFTDGAFPVQGLKAQNVIGSMLYLGLLSTMIAFLLQTVCQKYTQPSVAAILMSFESVFGMLFSVIFLHETFTVRIATGCLLMFCSVIISETCTPKQSG
jgi:drug/metabolite transporter (DMT)-like permease